MFRRLSWVVGVLFGFIGSIVFAGLIVTAPDLAGPGVATSGDGLVSSPNAPGTGFSEVVLWLVATTICFGVGFMLMRIAGWLIESAIPRRHHRHRTHAPSGNHRDSSGADHDGYDEEYEEQSVDVDESSIEPQVVPVEPGDRLPETCTEKVEPLEPPAQVEVVASTPRVTKRVDRPRVKFGRGVRSSPNTESAEKPRFRR